MRQPCLFETFKYLSDFVIERKASSNNCSSQISKKHCLLWDIIQHVSSFSRRHRKVFTTIMCYAMKANPLLLNINIQILLPAYCSCYKEKFSRIILSHTLQVELTTWIYVIWQAAIVWHIIVLCMFLLWEENPVLLYEIRASKIQLGLHVFAMLRFLLQIGKIFQIMPHGCIFKIIHLCPGLI